MTKEFARWNKSPLFSSLRDDMNTMLSDFWDENLLGMDWSPKIDISEIDTDITVKAEIPGIDP